MGLENSERTIYHPGARVLISGLGTDSFSLGTGLIYMNTTKHFCLILLTSQFWTVATWRGVLLALWNSDQCGDFAVHGFCLVIGGTSNNWWSLKWKKKTVGVPLVSFWRLGHRLGVLSWWLYGSSLYCNILSQSRDGWYMFLEWLKIPRSFAPS